MKAFKYLDTPTGNIYFVIFHLDDEGIHLMSPCWRFYPGRTEGEQVTMSALPWSARQHIADLIGEAMP